MPEYTWAEIEQRDDVKKLPVDMRRQLKRNFEKDQITSVPEVTVESQQPKPDKPRMSVSNQLLNTPSLEETMGGVGEPKTSTRKMLADPAVSLAKGVIGVGEAAVGLADIPTFGRVGKFMEDKLGYDAEGTQNILESLYSPEQQEANRAVADAKGFGGTAKAMIENPSTILQSTIETIPLMGAGGAVGRTLSTIGKMAPGIAAAIGEGAVGAGSAAESIRGQTEDRLLTPGQSASALASGAGTALFSRLGNKMAKKFGVEDIDELLSRGGTAVKSERELVGKIVAGGISEGLLEEAPQSAQETIWENAALGKPLLEGVQESVAQGLIVGSAMGGVVGGATGKASPTSAKDTTPGNIPAPENSGLPDAVLAQDGSYNITTKQSKQNFIINRNEANLRRAELPTVDMVQLRNDPTQMEELGVTKAGMDALILEKYDHIEGAIPELKKALDLGAGPKFFAGFEAANPRRGLKESDRFTDEITAKKEFGIPLIEKTGETEKEYQFKTDPTQDDIAIEKSHLPLDDEQKTVERRFAKQIADDVEGSIKAYNELPGTEGGRVLNVDEARELSPEYSASPEARGRFAKSTHEPSSWLMKEMMTRKLEEDFEGDSSVLFIAGGAGVGKTSAAKTASPELAQLFDTAEFILDGTFAGQKSAEEKLQQVLKTGRKVTIAYTARDPFESFAMGSLPRAERNGRTVPMDVSISAHKKAGDTFLALQEKFKDHPQVAFRVIDNTRGRGKAAEGGIDLVRNMRYDGIVERANEELERQFKSGKISERVYEGTKSTTPYRGVEADSRGTGRPDDGVPGRESKRERQEGRGGTREGQTEEEGEVVPIREANVEAYDDLNEADSKAPPVTPRQKVEHSVRKVYEKSSNSKQQTKAVMALLDARAASAGMTTDEYITTRGLSLMPNSKAFSQGIRQSNNAVIDLRKEGEAIIHVFEKANISSIPHELAHLFRQDVKGDDLTTLEKWAGVKDGKWDVPHEEKFARGFERYLRTGVAPNEELEGVFSQFKQWLREIYSAVTGSAIDVKISPEIKEIFDKLLTADAMPDKPVTSMKQQQKVLAQMVEPVRKFAEENTGWSGKSAQVWDMLKKLSDLDAMVREEVRQQTSSGEEIKYRLELDPALNKQWDPKIAQASELLGVDLKARNKDGTIPQSTIRTLFDRKTELPKVMKDFVGPLIQGHGRLNAYEINSALENRGDLRAAVDMLQDQINDLFGITPIVDENGIVTLGIERRMKTTPDGKKDPYRPHYGGFARSFSQTFMDFMPDEVFETFRGELTKAVEHAYKNGGNGLKGVTFMDKAIDNAGTSTFTTGRALRGAEKTVGALNLNSACPMFMIGSHGCYLDGCYVTGLGSAGTTISFYNRAAYTGELLQLHDKDVKLLNSVGGLRLNGQGDLTERQYPQLRDIIKHAKQRGLNLKIITKQDATLDMLQKIADEGGDISGVQVQTSIDPYWVPVAEDNLPDSFVQNMQMVEALERRPGDKRVLTKIVDLYGEMGVEAKAVNGTVYRKYGYSTGKYQEATTKYKDVNIQPRAVVGTPEEIVHYSRHHPEILQTWMHASIRPGMLSDINGELKAGDVGNFTARIAIIQDENGEWSIQAQKKSKNEKDQIYKLTQQLKTAEKKGQLEDVKNKKGETVPGINSLRSEIDRITRSRAASIPLAIRKEYTRVEDYIKSQPDADAIFKHLAGTLEGDPSSLCCSAGADKDACNNCTSNCHTGAPQWNEKPLKIPTAGEPSKGIFFQTIDSQEGSHTTQVNNAKAYANNLTKYINRSGKTPVSVLDYGAGLGTGTDAMREVLAGGRVDSFEPNPQRWKGKVPPTFTDNEMIEKTYDLVVNANVLNVVERTTRDAIVDDLISKLNPGGELIIGVRKAKGDVLNAKNATPGSEPGSIWVNKGGEQVYQKGFDGNELIEYLQEQLPEGFTVEKYQMGANGAKVTRNSGKVLAQSNTPQQKESVESWNALANDGFKVLEKGLRSPQASRLVNQAITDGDAYETAMLFREAMPGLSDKARAELLPMVERMERSMEGGLYFQNSWTPAKEDTWWQTTRYKIQDKLNPLKRVQDVLPALDEDIDVYLKEGLRVGKAQSKIDDFHEQHVDPILAEMKEKGIKLEDVEEIMYARHAKEANDRLRLINVRHYLNKLIRLKKGKEKQDLKDVLDIYDETAKNEGWSKPEKMKELLDLLERNLGGTTATMKDLERQWKRFSHAPSGMSDTTAAAILKRSDKGVVADIAKRVQALTEMKVEALLDAGLLSKEEAAAWRQYKNYIPLQREGFGDAGIAGSGKGISGGGPASKVRRGSSRKATNIFANIISDYERAISRAGKAESARALLDMVEANPNPDFWEVRTSSKMPKYDREGNIEFYTSGTHNPQHELAVKVDGKQFIISFNKDNESARRIAQALNGEDNPARTDKFVNFFAKLTRGLAMINTSWNPEFMISNAPRDLQTALFNIDSATDAKGLELRVLKDVAASFRGIRAALKGDRSSDWAKTWQDYKSHGAKVTWASGYDTPDAGTKQLKQKLEEVSTGKARMVSKKAFSSLMDTLELYNTAVENAVRLSFYKHAVDAGVSKPRAAIAAKELTVNFEKKGSAGAYINAFYMFANAGVQGNARMMISLVKSRKAQKMAAGALVMSMVINIMNRALGGDDENDKAYYDGIPEYIKERNLILMIPGTKGKFTKIPLPWGFNVFHVIGNQIGDMLSNPDSEAAGAAGNILSSMVNAFNPLQSATFAQFITPSLLDPFAMIGENKDWTGRNLMPGGFPGELSDKPNYQKHFSTVREPSKFMAKLLNDITGGDKYEPGLANVSPEWLDTIFDAYTGGTGRFLLNSLNVGLKTVTGRAGELEGKDIPFTRKVYGTRSESTNAQYYYNNVEKIDVVRKQLKDADTTAARNEIKNRYPAETKLVLKMKSAESKLRKLRSEKRKLTNAKAPDTEIDAVKESMNRVYSDFNRNYYREMRP